MQRAALMVVLVLSACGPPLQLPTQETYRSPFTGATIVRDRYLRFRNQSSDTIVAALRNEGVLILEAIAGSPVDMFLQSVGNVLALYIPPFDPDPASLPSPESPRILIRVSTEERVRRRVVLHEYSHYLLTSARFPAPVLVNGQPVFAGKRMRPEMLAIRKQLDAATEASVRADLSMRMLELGLGYALQAFLGEAEAFGMQIDLAEGMFRPDEVAELWTLLRVAIEDFESQAGLGTGRRNGITPCAYAESSPMLELLAALPAEKLARYEASLQKQCAVMQEQIDRARSYLERNRDVAQQNVSQKLRFWQGRTG